MLRNNPWNKSVPRVELDQRARDARVRLDQIERLAVPASAENVRLVQSAVYYLLNVVKIG
jgi:hypothetical protein